MAWVRSGRDIPGTDHEPTAVVLPCGGPLAPAPAAGLQGKAVLSGTSAGDGAATATGSRVPEGGDRLFCVRGVSSDRGGPESLPAAPECASGSLLVHSTRKRPAAKPEGGAGRFPTGCVTDSGRPTAGLRGCAPRVPGRLVASRGVWTPLARRAKGTAGGFRPRRSRRGGPGPGGLVHGPVGLPPRQPSLVWRWPWPLCCIPVPFF